MNSNTYWDEFPSAVTICDKDGVVVYMNQKSIQTFEKWGGEALIGKSLYDCHNEQSVKKIKEILATEIPNSYTIEKNGVKKLIHQSPWYENGNLAGLIEISVVLPEEMAHFRR